VQGAPFVSNTSSVHDDGRFHVATCYYKLQPEAQSVSLEIIAPSKSGASSPATLWREKFRSDDRRRGSHDVRVDGEVDAEKDSQPVHIDNLGDDAFWVNTGRDGALYLLSGNKIIRLSLGGKAAQNEKKARAIQITGSLLK